MTTYGRTNAMTGGGGTSTPTQTKEVQATAFPTVVTPDSGYALSQATVTAPANLTAENIKKDVTIAGVTGSFEGAPVGDLAAFIAGTLTDELTISELRPYAFQEYPNRISLTIAEGVTSIPNYFASRAYFNTVRLPSTLRTLAPSCFAGISTTKAGTFIMAEGIETIGAYSFQNRWFDTPFILPKSVKTIETSAFENGAKLVIQENNNLTTIKNSAFKYASVYQNDPAVETLHLENIITIGYQSFYSGAIPSTVILGENIQSIESEGLKPSSTQISKLIIKATTPPTVQSSSFYFATDAEIIVPVGSLSAYQSATNWSQYADHMVEATQ